MWAGDECVISMKVKFIVVRFQEIPGPSPKVAQHL